MKSKKVRILTLVAFIVASTGCYTYQESCAAYSYEENQENVENVEIVSTSDVLTFDSISEDKDLLHNYVENMLPDVLIDCKILQIEQFTF